MLLILCFNVALLFLARRVRAEAGSWKYVVFNFLHLHVTYLDDRPLTGCLAASPSVGPRHVREKASSRPRVGLQLSIESTESHSHNNITGMDVQPFSGQMRGLFTPEIAGLGRSSPTSTRVWRCLPPVI